LLPNGVYFFCYRIFSKKDYLPEQGNSLSFSLTKLPRNSNSNLNFKDLHKHMNPKNKGRQQVYSDLVFNNSDCPDNHVNNNRFSKGKSKPALDNKQS